MKLRSNYGKVLGVLGFGIRKRKKKKNKEGDIGPPWRFQANGSVYMLHSQVKLEKF